MPALLAALALSSAFSSARQTSAVTVTTGLGSVESTLEAVGRAMNKPLRATPRVAGFSLMVRVENVAPNDLLTRIADVVGGEWRQDGDTLVLSSDAGLETRLGRQLDPKRVAVVAARLATMVSQTEALQFDEAFAKGQRAEGQKLFGSMMAGGGAEDFNPGKFLSSSLMTQSPATKAIAQILAKIGPEPLAGMRLGDRVVLALAPTRAQGRLPAGSEAIVRRFLSENAALVTAMKNTAPNDGSFDLMGMMAGGLGGLGGGPTPAAGPEALGFAHLELTLAAGTIAAQLKAFDRDGAPIGNGLAIIDLPSPEPAPLPRDDPGEPLSVTPLGSEWGAKYRAIAEGTVSPQNGFAAIGAMFSKAGVEERNRAFAKGLSPELRTFLTSLDVRQPAEPLFTPVAAALRGNLVATVPDDGLVTLAGIVTDPKATTTTALRDLRAANAYSVVQKDGWTVVGAATPARLREAFADRVPLANLTRAVMASGYPRLADLAGYAVLQRNVAGALSLGAPIVALVQGPSALSLATNPLVTEFETLRVWGSLSKEQRDLLANGRGVAYSALSADASAALARILYNSPIGPSEEPGDGSPNPMAMLGGIFGTENRAAERTVRFPDGVPTGGYFTARFDTGETYKMTDSNSGATIFGDAGMLGFLRGAKSVPVLAAFSGSAQYDRFTPAKQTTIALRFVFGPKLTAIHGLQDQEVGSGPALTYNQLPAEFRNQVDEVAKIAGQMKSPPKPIKP